jgi:hypothetical protein
LIGTVNRRAGAGALGLIHREIRVAQQAIGILAVIGRQGDADAYVDGDRMAVQHKRRLQRSLDIACDVCRACGVSPCQQNCELISAQTSHQTIGQDGLAETLADLLQQAVANLMSQGVVNFLEAIEVEQEQRNSCAIIVQRFIQASPQQTTIG